MIKISNLTFEYFDRDEEGNLTDMINAIRGINLEAGKGEFIGIMGRNGSGKSTLARILNGLLIPVEGTIIINNMNAMDRDNRLSIRKSAGMVFQNPDDQIIGSIVSEDVAFGAENIGVPEKQLWKRVIEAISRVGLANGEDLAEKVSKKPINSLSGGEKQKVAIAGVLAMKPECIVLDEATSMLDPKSRWEIITLMKRLASEFGITVIMITHMMDELLQADKILVMDKGKIVMAGRREAIFSGREKLLECGLDVPEVIKLRDELYEDRIIDRKDIFTVDKIISSIKLKFPMAFEKNTDMPVAEKNVRKLNPGNAILLNKATFSYGRKKIIENISLQIKKGEYVSIIGPTGSGKSTLLQVMSGLLKCNREMVYVDGLDINDRSTDILSIRRKIGYVFQYPEKQLFAKNVYEDVVFGPRNMGISEVEAEKRAYECIELVGLSQDVYDMPIKKLSGGQKRRVALAGVLAMKPEYLILDEPVAGLDPVGKQEMLDIIGILHRESNITIVCVSHDIESVAAYSDRVIALEGGKVVVDDTSANAFYRMWNADRDNASMLPVIMQVLTGLRKEGLPVDCITKDRKKGIDNIKSALGRHYRG